MLRWSFARPVALVAIAVVLVASGLRVWHVGWGLPDVEEEAFPSKVAIDMWGFDDGKADLDPGTAGWPALSFYLQRAVQQLHYLAGRAGGRFSGPLDYYVAWLLDPTAVILLGRLTSVLCGLLVCLVALRAGYLLADAGGALVAGGVCALSPLLVSHAQLVEPDALVTAFSALALLQLLRVSGGGRVRDYALTGLWIGLGTASKYTPALMALSLYAVHLERRRIEGLTNRGFGLDDRRLGWAALVALLSFCVASPYTLADLGVLRRDFAYQALHMSSGHFGHEQQGLGYAYYLRQVLPAGLGWPALLAGLAGLALGARESAARRVPLWSLLPYLVVLGSLSTHFERYMLPVVLPLALGCAMLVDLVRRRAGRFGPAVVAACSVGLLLAPAWGAVRYHERQGTGSTAEIAATWIESHMDMAHEVLATEQYGPALPRDEREEVRADPAFARMSPGQQERLLGRPFVRILTIPMYSVRTELSAYYYDLRNYLAYDWLVTSGAVRNRYLGSAARFPRQVDFYTLLDELTAPVWSIRPEGRLRGPAIQVYRIDDSLRQAVRDRLGPREVEHFRAFGGQVHAPHFVGFIQTIAAHAEFRERWSEAAFWNEVLGQAGLDPATRARGFERAGQIHLRLRQYRRARDLFLALAEYPPRAAVALGNLGLIAEETGDVEAARRYYEQVLERDVRGEPAAWARRRLEQLGS